MKRTNMRALRALPLCALGVLGGGFVAAACEDRFNSCEESRTCPRGGGDGGDAGGPGGGAAGSEAGTADTGGMGNGGTAGDVMSQGGAGGSADPDEAAAGGAMGGGSAGEDAVGGAMETGTGGQMGSEMTGGTGGAGGLGVGDGGEDASVQGGMDGGGGVGGDVGHAGSGGTEPVVECTSMPCASDYDCQESTTDGACDDQSGDCLTTLCVGANRTTTGLNSSTTTRQEDDDPTDDAAWYCDTAFPMPADGVILHYIVRTLPLAVDASLQVAVVRCAVGGDGSGEVLDQCTRVAVGGAVLAGEGGVEGETLVQVGVDPATQLDGAVSSLGRGIVVQQGDFLCVDGRSVSIGVDCNGTSSSGGCPGPDFNVQTTDVDLAGDEPLEAFSDASENGFLTIFGLLWDPGTCTDTAPDEDMQPCNVTGGDTCCSGVCTETEGAGCP